MHTVSVKFSSLTMLHGLLRKYPLYSRAGRILEDGFLLARASSVSSSDLAGTLDRALAHNQCCIGLRSHWPPQRALHCLHWMPVVSDSTLAFRCDSDWQADHSG